ncbi:hypothetical protein A1O1_01288 [Capronia coronata CBS 617.96]|uniref:Uncharacterized protein n=1 Tax=Capronia coronata CBS 617.96 TaxID=1182541 RepID=W9YTD3_9EURO|nr:uncharacterized protein A1O1_01288 [Capronia coronata CBS 617.96]EXJ96162.1 hypothetical protein A1O1_01288 [Capronia coronata CBS 617.96]
MASSRPGLQGTTCPPSQPNYPPYREPPFEVAIERGKSIAKTIADTKGLPENLLREAEELAEYRLPTETVLRFLGNCGDGKSSTINSVLDEEGIACTAACGSAVTLFSVEYRLRQPQHSSAFTVDCALMFGAELGTYLGRLLEDFRQIDLADPQERTADLEGLEADSLTARQVFEIAFGKMDGFDLAMLEHDDDDKSREIAVALLKSYAARLEFRRR